MKITYLTQQTWEKVYEPENKEPSLTRESDYVSIEDLFAKFKANPMLADLYQAFKPIAQLSPEEKDVLYNGTDLDDLADEDILVQKEFIDSVHDSILKKPEEKVEKENANQTVKQDDPQPSTDKATEVK